jgi:hypothetical protein
MGNGCMKYLSHRETDLTTTTSTTTTTTTTTTTAATTTTKLQYHNRFEIPATENSIPCQSQFVHCFLTHAHTHI